MAAPREIAQLGHPVLRAPARPVPIPLPDAVRVLLGEMACTLEAASGVGIAAPQVYESLALFLMLVRVDSPSPETPAALATEVVINPEIVERSPDLVKGWEGCLSIPGLRGLVPRHRGIRARYYTAEGSVVERAFTDFAARVFQHEFDHLHGIVFLDRLENSRDLFSEQEYHRQFVLPKLEAEGRTPA
jgi:peptide deformylase